MSAVWTLGRAGRVPKNIHGMQFFTNHDDSRLLVEAYVRPQTPEDACRPVAAALMEELKSVVGMAVFATSPVEDENRQLAPLSSVPSEPALVIGAGHLTYHVGEHDYQVSGGSFFQTNRFLIDELVKVAVGDEKGNLALDLYAGVGLFTLSLAANFREVTAVEASPHATADLKHNVPVNVRVVRATTESFLTQQVGSLTPEFVLLDPPRAGLGEKATTALCRTSASRVTYVSCDPATLSRDLRLLLESGFTVEQAHLFDLFPQTAHMETVLQLVR